MSHYGKVRPQPNSHSDAGGRRYNPSAQATRDAVVPPVVREVLISPGLPLDMATRTFMEPRFGHDFGKVRVHADDRAAESAQAVNALAYTAGRHVVFAAGSYRPESDEGKRLLAHELAHVVQQGPREGAAVTSVSPFASPQEAEAARAAAGALSSHTLRATANMPGAGLARQPSAPDQEPKPAEEKAAGEKPISLVPKQEAVAEREREVEVVVVGDDTYIVYQKEVRWKGSSAWRANNPGNLDYTPDTVAWGAYDGKKLPWGDHRFAIFPFEETGLLAVRKFLRKHQRERDIRLMMEMFAPSSDVDNRPKDYADDVAAALKVPVTTLVKNLSDKQIEVFADKIKEKEGWTEGKHVPRGDPSLPEAVRSR